MGICSADDGATLVSVIPSASAADTTAATSGWIDCRSYIGTVIFDIHSGAITGSFVGKIQTASDGSGTNAADITGATHTATSTANQVKSIIVPASNGPYMKYIGTVTTGPVVLSVTMRARKQTV